MAKKNLIKSIYEIFQIFYVFDVKKVKQKQWDDDDVDISRERLEYQVSSWLL